MLHGSALIILTKFQISMLKTLIKEAGHECILLPKFHCELNPIEMVCYFNFSVMSFGNSSIANWQFMDAYQVLLSGKAAMWAVHKQTGHCTISKSTMMHLNTIINQTWVHKMSLI